jgi:hypothetical protein
VKPFGVVAASVCAVPLILAIAAIYTVADAALGGDPFWHEPQLTMAEAAALKDRATMQRLIWSGVDPNAPANVRANVLKSHDIVVTPLEASVGTRTPVAMQFLLAHGARMDRNEQDVITCLAKEDDAKEILEYLAKNFPGARPDCAHVSTPW